MPKNFNSDRSNTNAEFLEGGEYFYNQIIQHLPGAFYTCNAKGVITFYNQSAVELWGREPVIGKDMWCGSWKIFQPDGQPLPLDTCPMAIALKEGRSVQGAEIIVERPDGIRRHILPHPNPIFDPEGKLIGAFNILVDVTEIKSAEQKTKESERFLQRLIASSNDCIKVLDLDARLLSMNEGGMCMLEIDDIAPFLGNYWVDFWQGEDRESALKAVNTAKAGGKGRFTGFFPLVKSKEPRWWDVVVSPILNEQGKPEKLLSVSRDVTEQKILQDTLNDKSKSFEILNQIGKTISSELELDKVVQAITDAATQISGAQFGAFFYNLVNDQGEHYTLYTVSGVPRENFSKFPMPRNTEVFAPTFHGSAIVRSDDITKDPRYGKNAPHHGMPKGHLPVTSYLAVPVISRTGTVVGGLFFGHSKPAVFTQKSEDLVLAIAAQAAIAMDNSKLYEASKKDKEKLALVNRELNEKYEELQRINIDLDNFIYTASHDLKSPVSNIEGLINTLSDVINNETPLKEEIIEIIQLMNSSILRFSKTIQDLTTITKIQKETEEEFVEKVNMIELIEDIKLLNGDLIANSGARIRIGCEECMEINFSRKNLKSILYNLITNAIKYRSPDRRPEVQISTEKKDGYVILSVKDNGLGLDESKQKKLFSMFKRFHDHVEGTGIGLYLVKRIVTNAGGKIEVESAPDVGSTFKVYFPL